MATDDVVGSLERSNEPVAVLEALARRLGMRVGSKGRKSDLAKRIATHIANRRSYDLLRNRTAMASYRRMALPLIVLYSSACRVTGVSRMPRKELAVVGLFVALIIAGCASPTPTPEPTATPSPTPTAEPTAAGLGYAEEEGLEGEDAETYASAFADSKALGLGDADARDYATALVYLNAFTAAAWSAYLTESIIGRFIEAFDEAVKTDGAPASHAVSYAYAIALDGDEACAAEYAKAFAQTEASGVASHVYAVYYVQPCGHGAPDDFAASLTEANARGYALSSASSVRERLAYAEWYMTGYSEAILMAAHERGYARESLADNWAEFIAGEETRAHIYAATYAAAYEEAYMSQKEGGATEDDAHLYAAAHAYALADAKLGIVR